MDPDPGLGLEKVFQTGAGRAFRSAGSGTGKAIFCVVIAAVWQSTGFVMALFLAGLRGVDGEIFKAAQMDGASTHHLPQDRDSEHAPGVLLRAADSLPHHDQDLRPGRRVDRGRSGHVVVAAGDLHVHVFVQSRADCGVGAASSMMMLATVVAVLVPLMYLESRSTRNAA